MQYLQKNWLVIWKLTRNLVNFHGRSHKSENVHFDGLVLSKVYEKVQNSYVSWHWRVIQRKANSWEIWIFCVMQLTWSSPWKVLLKCRENLWQQSWMKFILYLTCVVSPYPWCPRHILPSPRQAIYPHPKQSNFQNSPLFFWGYLNSQFRINKIVNSLDDHPCPSKLASRIYRFIFL